METRTATRGSSDSEVPSLRSELLSARLTRLGPRPLAEVTTIVTQLCAALERMHARGTSHGQLAPARVLLDDRGGDIVELLPGEDRQSGTAPSESISDPLPPGGHYLSPEQLLGSGSEEGRADLWAVAVVAYEALTGAPPFAGKTVEQLIVATTEARFEPPYERQGLGTTGLDAWFARAFTRDPEKRFPDARELCAGFLRASEHSGPQAVLRRRESANAAPRRPLPARDGNRWWPLSLGLVLLALVLAAAWHGRRGDSPANDNPAAAP